ncbi:hypothetical protein SAMN04244579_03868 [Azotobacter beijerinckii]|uniref:Cytochrome oxidase Cu insertion factor, SCO1/SenC/PrrC family n=1 Tax=Azotobacter beijerinckii TaxID=170623 RepID=A0A1H6XNQ8_9GAMM|nr:hypothetical protein [Azotobacter beijerinckii]SEJ30703.1 hypothetical protein SAMN04244579_03868 [Azotobacter beijerinckii]
MPLLATPTECLPPRRRGRLQLLALFAVAFGPMLLAGAMYHWRFWVPEGRTYHGTLIGTGQHRAELGVVPAGDGEPRWELLVTAPAECAADCRQLVYLARQINIGLGREADRGAHALAVGQPPSAAETERLEREYPRLGRYRLERATYERGAPGLSGAQLWIVDPLGNLVLRYDAGADGKGVLEDLRLLLKLSKIG